MAIFNTTLQSKKTGVNYKVGHSIAHRESSSSSLKRQLKAKGKIESLKAARALGVSIDEYLEMMGATCE
ncbi:hypothetical protein [Vibrio sonorensis]|uniref:hypothetical protein n=1 Tax=Vibrio sonorensis TaxID=1004316 RepID=UPI0008DA2BA4|nr:hypothetical protein [Vibrio sonorensis]